MKSVNSLIQATFILLLALPALGQHKVVATIPVGTFPISIAVNPQTNTIYAANLRGNSVSVMDGATNMVTATLPIMSPVALVAYAAKNQVFVYQQGGTVSVIYGATNKISRMNSLPSGVAVAGLGNTSTVYVADQSNSQVHVEDLSSRQDIVDIPITMPNSVSTNAAASLAYTSSVLCFCSNIAVIDTTSNKVVNTFTPPFVLTSWQSLDPFRNLLYALVLESSGSHLFVVLDATTGNLVGSVDLGDAEGLAAVLALPGGKAVVTGGPFDPQGQNNRLMFFDGNPARLTTQLMVGRNPFAMAYNSKTKVLYVANTFDNTVSVVAW